MDGNSMQRSIVFKSALLAFISFIWVHAAELQTVGFSGSIPDDYQSKSTFLSLIDIIPQHNAGVSHSTGVPDDTTFGVLIESQYGINLADSDSIRFEIDDGVHFVYTRDLSSDTMRVVEVIAEDPNQTLIWVVYDRSMESYLPPLYFPDKIVRITVRAIDTRQNSLSPRQFRFKIESDSGPDTEFDRLPDYDFMDRDQLLSETKYDSGMEILSGELEGAKVIYNSQEPLTPGFGPIDQIEALNLADRQGIGAPLNLIPHTIFHTPVKIMIPFAEGTDIANMDIFYHNGVEWLPACDADGNVLPGGRGWMVRGSRVNHFGTSPPLVEIQVYHFSAAQGGFIVVNSGTTTRDNEHTNQSGTVVVAHCFIDTAIDNPKPVVGLLAFIWVVGLLGLLPVINAVRFFTRKRLPGSQGA
jgi:hypothetical protein